jgi:hypothetical protein
MRGFRLLLAGAALLVAGSLGADALPAGANPLAGLETGHKSEIVPVRTRRSTRCFRRCVIGGRLSCRRANSVEACCRRRCRHY